MITLFLNKLKQCRPGKTCTSAFSFNSPLNPSTLPLPALWDTAAYGGARKLLHFPEAKVLKTVSCRGSVESRKTPRHIAVETGATLQPLKSNVKEGTMPISF